MCTIVNLFSKENPKKLKAPGNTNYKLRELKGTAGSPFPEKIPSSTPYQRN